MRQRGSAGLPTVGKSHSRGIVGDRQQRHGQQLLQRRGGGGGSNSNNAASASAAASVSAAAPPLTGNSNSSYDDHDQQQQQNFPSLSSTRVAQHQHPNYWEISTTTTASETTSDTNNNNNTDSLSSPRRQREQVPSALFASHSRIENRKSLDRTYSSGGGLGDGLGTSTSSSEYYNNHNKTYYQKQRPKLHEFHTVFRNPHHVPDHLYKDFMTGGAAAVSGLLNTNVNFHRQRHRETSVAHLSVAERRRLRRQRQAASEGAGAGGGTLTESCVLQGCAGFSVVAALFLGMVGLLLDRQPLYIPGVLPPQLAFDPIRNKMVIQYLLPTTSAYRTDGNNDGDNDFYRLTAASSAYQAALAYCLVLCLCLYRMQSNQNNQQLSSSSSQQQQSTLTIVIALLCFLPSKVCDILQRLLKRTTATTTPMRKNQYQDIPDHHNGGANNNGDNSNNDYYYNEEDDVNHNNGSAATATAAYQQGNLWNRTKNSLNSMSYNLQHHWLFHKVANLYYAHQQQRKRKQTPKTV